MAIFRTFGENPKEQLLSDIGRSVHFREGSFQNLSPTSLMAGNSSMLKNIWKFMNKPANTVPPSNMPSVRTNLTGLGEDNPVIVWFGHSSYYFVAGGKRILVDPVFSGNASPFSFGARSFPGANVYDPDDFPSIDLLILTHDHYDHLDYETILKLRGRVKQIVTSLGVSAHLRYWGFEPRTITELDWWQSTEIGDGMTVTATPARHFSGRSFVRNKTFWSSFVLNWGGLKIFIGGDSGYDQHFREIGEKLGPFDLALLECGQYNEQWPDIHMMPEMTVQAAIDLKAKAFMPVHWAKFALSLHAWDDPIKRVTASAAARGVPILTPMIGEPVALDQPYPVNHWWDAIQ
jgi:L-ascorbate metabolism protein UlaG (beta-lactamase superfamily)